VIVYGRNAVREALRGRRAGQVHDIWLTAAAAREGGWPRDARSASAEEIAERCGSDGHQGVCADAGDYRYADPRDLVGPQALIVALDQIQDPQNLGAICRTAECAGAAGVVIPERRAAQVTGAVCKASAGAVEHLPVAQVRNLADFLVQARDSEMWSYGASADRVDGADDPVPYDSVDYGGGGVVLVLGSEGEGLRRRVASECDQLISLPVRGNIGSLNVSAAAAALLYAILQKTLDNSP
jgi:23S rRNA (guanosine2251-2'-O)-methyltransferase